jgi:hypothetical protein
MALTPTAVAARVAAARWRPHPWGPAGHRAAESVRVAARAAALGSVALSFQKRGTEYISEYGIK